MEAKLLEEQIEVRSVEIEKSSGVPVDVSEAKHVHKKVNETQSKTKDNVHEVKSNPVTSNVQLNPNAPIWEGNKDVNESKITQQAQIVNSNEGVSATQLCDALLMAVNIPKPEMVKFDGDPMNYWNFINSFEVNIANKAKDERTKLMYLYPNSA